MVFENTSRLEVTEELEDRQERGRGSQKAQHSGFLFL